MFVKSGAGFSEVYVRSDSSTEDLVVKHRFLDLLLVCFSFRISFYLAGIILL